VYPHQAERLQAELERGGFAALVAATPANVAYVTGFQSLVAAVDPATEVYAVVAPGGTALVVPTMEALAVAEGDADASHVVCHGLFHYAETDGAGERATRLRRLIAEPAARGADALAAALALVGVRSGRVGIDDVTLPEARLAALRQALSGYTLATGSVAFATARAIKSPYEIDCLRRVLHATEESLDAVLAMLHPGLTEHEAGTAFVHEAAKRGATPYRTIIAFGADAAVPASAPGERALRLGDLVRFDLGCILKGYRSNVARMAVMGEPNERQQARFDALHAGVEAALDSLRPEISAGQVFDATVAAIRKAGLAHYARHHVGHAIGLDPIEAPMLAPGGAALEMGMVVCAEAPYYAVGDAGFTITETALITRTGAHSLNRSHRGLIVLD
jgi:Xaa-Pro aminopeptidase